MSKAVTIDKGKITYQSLSIPSDEVCHIAERLGYDETDREWYVYNIPYFTENIRKIFEKTNIKYYHPTYTEVVKGEKKGTKPRTLTRSKTLSYVFVIATKEEVEELKSNYSINPVYRHINHYDDKPALRNPNDRWLTLSKNEMHSVMLIAEGYEKTVTFITPSQHMLELGDRVLIIDGDFVGVEGILITNQGSRKGASVFVSINGTEGMLTSRIPDDNIQVLELGKGSDRFYRKIKSFEGVLEECLSCKAANKVLTGEQLANLFFFLVRYERLQGLTLVNAAKLCACRYAALMLLGRKEKAKETLQKFFDDTNSSREGRKNIKRSPSSLNYIDSWKNKVEGIIKD